MQSAFLQKLLSVTGPEWRFQNGQLTMFGSIANLHSNGVSPLTVLDIGAHVGTWTKRAAKIFPEARFHMIEAEAEQKPKLEAVAASLKGRAGITIALLGAEARESSTFYSMGTGSSVLEEATTFDRKLVSMPMYTIDTIIEQENLKGPFFVKLDVQGYEIEVMKGGNIALTNSEAVLMEVALLEYNRGAPLINEVFEFMSSFGFVPYDFCSQLRRSSDGALFQTDIIFVPHDSKARQKKKFWKHEP